MGIRRTICENSLAVSNCFDNRRSPWSPYLCDCSRRDLLMALPYNGQITEDELVFRNYDELVWTTQRFYHFRCFQTVIRKPFRLFLSS